MISTKFQWSTKNREDGTGKTFCSKHGHNNHRNQCHLCRVESLWISMRLGPDQPSMWHFRTFVSGNLLKLLWKDSGFSLSWISLRWLFTLSHGKSPWNHHLYHDFLCCGMKTGNWMWPCTCKTSTWRYRQQKVTNFQYEIPPQYTNTWTLSG